MNHSNKERHLQALPTTGPVLPARADSARSRALRPLLAPIALAGAVGILGGGDRVLSAASDTLPAGPASPPQGLSVRQLQRTPKALMIPITPTQAEAAKGPSELGELVDPSVYQGPDSNSTTADNLNTMISDQHSNITGVVKAGLKYEVPSLPPTDPNKK